MAEPSRAASLEPRALSPIVRAAVAVTALINLVVGLSFLVAPELGLVLWPTPISPVLSRFIGSIILGNAGGAWLVARAGTWDAARVLFAVALVYGVIVLIAVSRDLVFAGAPSVLWGYVIVDAVFLVPIAYIFWSYERSSRRR